MKLLADIPGDLAVQTLNIIKIHCHGNSKMLGSYVAEHISAKGAVRNSALMSTLERETGGRSQPLPLEWLPGSPFFAVASSKAEEVQTQRTTMTVTRMSSLVHVIFY